MKMYGDQNTIGLQSMVLLVEIFTNSEGFGFVTFGMFKSLNETKLIKDVFFHPYTFSVCRIYVLLELHIHCCSSISIVVVAYPLL